MDNYKIVFSDIDGTLLNSQHKITPLTSNAISLLNKKNIPFVIVSARSPSGIFPIMKEANFTGPIISYSGALILDSNKKPLYTDGITKSETILILNYAEQKKLDVVWCAYCIDEWVVKDKSNIRVKTEESIVKAQSVQKPIESFSENSLFNKIMFICDPLGIDSVENTMKLAFPEYSIVKSSDIMLEIMKKGINKGDAVKNLCKILNISISCSLAFGDNYNDLPMLTSVGLGYLMANSPKPLQQQITNITSDNDHDGIYYALKNLGII